MPERAKECLTLSCSTSGDFSRIQSKIHASDKYILRFISVRSMSGPERVNNEYNKTNQSDNTQTHNIDTDIMIKLISAAVGC